MAQGSPESIARGGALGMWIALTPTVGIQMPMVLVMSVPLKANMAVGMAMCWITNPVTLIPFYFAFYWLGALLLGRVPREFTEVAAPLSAAIEHGSITEFVTTLGGEVLWPMVVGSVVLATLAAVPTYHLMLAIFRRRSREAATADSVQAGPSTADGSDSQDDQGATP